MSAEKGSLLAILACILFYILYSQYLSSQYPPNRGQERNENIVSENREQRGTPQPNKALSGSNQADRKSSLHETIPQDYEKLSQAELLFSNAEVSYQYDQTLGGFTTIKLFNYRDATGIDGHNVDLASNPLIIQGGVDLTKVAGVKYLQARREGRTLVVWHKQGNWLITQELGFPDQGYGLDIQFRFKNISSTDQELTSTILLTGKLAYGKESSSFIPVMPTERMQIITGIRGEMEWEDLHSYCTDSDTVMRNKNTYLDLMGFDRHYFLSMLVTGLANTNFSAEPISQDRSSCHISLLAYQKQGLLSSQEQVTIPIRAYFGPKVLEELVAYDPKLEKTLDLGWFSAISLPLLAIIKWIYGFVGNYGIAIILLTIIIKILFYPLTRQSTVSMQRMKNMQPQMNSIRERFKDDPKAQQQELMKFMVANKVNPMKGCLPILPQIPVFFAFYRVLSTSIELRHAPFFGWIMDLSTKDPYYITPLLLGVCMFVQQKLTPMTGMDKNQQKIMMLMPVVFTVMMLSLPSGMVIYMLTNTVVSVMQQQWLSRKFAKQSS